MRGQRSVSRSRLRKPSSMSTPFTAPPERTTATSRWRANGIHRAYDSPSPSRTHRPNRTGPTGPQAGGPRRVGRSDGLEHVALGVEVRVGGDYLGQRLAVADPVLPLDVVQRRVVEVEEPVAVA